MKKLPGKIILVDDEKMEKDLIAYFLAQLEWDICIEFFDNAIDALEHLRNTKDNIFLIISDMKMPRMTGLELKRIIDNDKYLKHKAIPFIFLSNAATKEEVGEAYDYRVQGYFKKPIDTSAMAEMLDIIIRYWVICIHPRKME